MKPGALRQRGNHVHVDSIDPLALAIALRRAQLRRADGAAVRALMLRLAQLADRMRAHPVDDRNETSMSPVEICCCRALRASNDGEDVSGFWSALKRESVAWVRSNSGR
jgi:hypothetical protein